MKWLIEVKIIILIIIINNIYIGPLFSGDSEIDQIFKIFQMYGTPTEKTWPGVTKLPDFKTTFPQFRAKGVSSYCSNLDEYGLDLLSKMIVYDPCKRISAKNALNHVKYLNNLFYNIALFR
jgi:serine/threonine protein kinase